MKEQIQLTEVRDGIYMDQYGNYIDPHRLSELFTEEGGFTYA